MGALHNNSLGITAGPALKASHRLRRRLLGLTGLLSVLLLIPAASVADPALERNAAAAKSDQSAQSAIASPADKAASGNGSPVSMSPNLQGQRPNTSTTLTPLEGDQTLRPLTRAAAQLKVETMSPTDWLSSFGNVTVGRLDPTPPR